MTKSPRGGQPGREGGVLESGGFRSVVVPVDLTSASDRVVGRLALLPLAGDAQVTLLHVVPRGLSPGERRSAERDASRALAEEARHLRNKVNKRVRIESLVRAGVPGREITACATKVGADLIVMGRGAGRGLRDALLGSTAERVVRQACLPVLVVRLAPRGAYSRPVLALDLDPSAHDVVRLLLLVVPPPVPPVEVVHAVEAPYHRLIYPSLPMGEEDEWREEQCSKAAQGLAGLLATALRKADVPPERWPAWKVHVRYGPPRLVVEKAIRKSEPDLLALGTHGHSGAAFVFLGTVAGELLRAARCDVLIVPPRSPGAALRQP